MKKNVSPSLGKKIAAAAVTFDARPDAEKTFATAFDALPKTIAKVARIRFVKYSELNNKPDRLTESVVSLSSAIWSGFDWFNTPEGHAYWESVAFYTENPK